MTKGVNDQRAKTKLKTEMLEWSAVRFSIEVTEWFQREDTVEPFDGACKFLK